MEITNSRYFRRSATYRPLDTTEQHIAAFVKWVDDIPYYPQGSAVTFFAYTPCSRSSPEGGSIVVRATLHDTSAAVCAPAFDRFFDIAPAHTSSTLRVDSHLNMTVELEEPSGYRQIWITLTGLNDERFLRNAVYAQTMFVAQCMLEF